MNKNSPANAGDTGSIPGPGTLHMLWNIQACVPELLSAHAAATEACMPRAYAPQQGKSPQWEAHTPQWRVAPALCNQRKTHESNKDQKTSTAKNK